MAWTFRNSATFAPVVAALFWPVVTKRAVVTALFTGFASGLLWYYLGDWHPNEFFLNIHPVWVGSSVNVLSITLVTLLDPGSKWFVRPADRFGYFGLLGGVILAGINAVYFSPLHQNGLFGLFMFASILCLFIAVMRFIRPKNEKEQLLRDVADL
ncbi:hypothetical protein [Lentibacillus sp. CBA3610]|uniref:hypothetical protein n=1 Tax=Lentibacillus sp. CBA3610 TaxID=2518176 RepID=UPI0020D22A6F|nr:hypothetical protein [Lentibacillus sp. CBA3610]